MEYKIIMNEKEHDIFNKLMITRNEHINKIKKEYNKTLDYSINSIVNIYKDKEKELNKKINKFKNLSFIFLIISIIEFIIIIYTIGVLL